jgi:hypothetical protein
MAQPFNLSQEKMPLAVELREAAAANIALRKRIAKHEAEAPEAGESGRVVPPKSALRGLSFGLGFGESVAHIPETPARSNHTANDSARFL